MIAEDKSKRTRQIQFRMNPEKVKKLQAMIAYDDNMRSMADLFNEAADEYIKKQNAYIQQAGGKEND